MENYTHGFSKASASSSQWILGKLQYDQILK